MISQHNKIVSLLLPVCFLLTGFGFSQQSQLNKAESFLKEKKLDSATIILKAIDTLSLEPYQNAYYHFHIAELHFLNDNHHKAFHNFLMAKRIFTASDSIEQAINVNLKIIATLNHFKHHQIDDSSYLAEYIAYAKNKNDAKILQKAYTRIAVTYLNNDNGKQAINNFDKAIQLAQQNLDTLGIAKLNFNKGTTYRTEFHKPKIALEIYRKTIPTFQKYNQNTLVSYAYNNIARCYANLKEYQLALMYYGKAMDINLSKHVPKTKIIYYDNLRLLYDSLRDYKNAYIYSQKIKKLEDSINEVSQINAIAKYNTQYETEKKEKENILLQYEIDTRRRQQRNLWIGALLTLLGTISISLLLYKNTKRKQRIAEQEKQLETNKVEKILKEQELTTIDAMLSGQEKERQRLANDLHDSLGSTLTTIKLYFDHLKRNRSKPEFINDDAFYVKTTTLIDEAYQKVRAIAHEKNSGVMAQQGLLPAIKNLAKKISSSNQLKITVQDYGFNQRLDNTLEISLFRIIQELITNIVKHAQATEATISLTHHDTSLNIIIEDNGIGFNAVKLPQKEGMGLHSIEKRIEHLEGDFEIDSTPEKGTNILIDIPL
ncbi:tetratricopeptide repeat-containing sensor histidine kinase [Aquimarina rhabdastrellae]